MSIPVTSSPHTIMTGPLDREQPFERQLADRLEALCRLRIAELSADEVAAALGLADPGTRALLWQEHWTLSLALRVSLILGVLDTDTLAAMLDAATDPDLMIARLTAPPSPSPSPAAESDIFTVLFGIPASDVRTWTKFDPPSGAVGPIRIELRCTDGRKRDRYLTREEWARFRAATHPPF